MKNLSIVLAIAAIMSIPGSMVIPQAFAGTDALGTVNVLGACEVVASGGMAYGSLSPLQGASAEQTVNLSNSGNLDSTTLVAGSDWDQTTPAAPVEMLVGTTHYDLASDNTQNGYDNNKTPLTITPASLTTLIGQAAATPTFWQLEVLLEAGASGFEGAIEQTVTFSFSCA